MFGSADGEADCEGCLEAPGHETFRTDAAGNARVGIQREAPYKKSPSQNGQLVRAVLSSLIADSWEGEPMNIALALMVVVVGLFLVNIMGARD